LVAFWKQCPSNNDNKATTEVERKQTGRTRVVEVFTSERRKMPRRLSKTSLIVQGVYLGRDDSSSDKAMEVVERKQKEGI